MGWPERRFRHAENGKTASKPCQCIRVRGGDLKYSDAERKAVMHAGVLGAVVAETGTANSSSDAAEFAAAARQSAGKDGGRRRWTG